MRCCSCCQGEVTWELVLRPDTQSLAMHGSSLMRTRSPDLTHVITLRLRNAAYETAETPGMAVAALGTLLSRPDLRAFPLAAHRSAIQMCCTQERASAGMLVMPRISFDLAVLTAVYQPRCRSNGACRHSASLL